MTVKDLNEHFVIAYFGVIIIITEYVQTIFSIHMTTSLGCKQTLI